MFAGVLRALPRGRALVTGALLVGLMGVGTTDGIVVHRQWAADAAAKRRVQAQIRYLDNVSDLAAQVRRHVQPLFDVLAELTSPRPGDLIAVRDALANKGPLRDLEHDLDLLENLEVPPAYAHSAVDLRDALQSMRDAASAIHALSGDNDIEYLRSELQGTQNAALSSGARSWRAGLQMLFIRRRRPVPETPTPFPTGDKVWTLLSWGFAADRACIRANLRAFPLIASLNKDNLDTDAIRKLGDIIRDAALRITKLREPDGLGDDLHRNVLGRLPLLRSEGQAFIAEANAIDSHSFGRLGAALDQLKTVRRGLPSLARGFRHYHLAGCAGMVGAPARAHKAVSA